VLGDAASLAAWRGAEELAGAACDFGAATLQQAQRVADAQPSGSLSISHPQLALAPCHLPFVRRYSRQVVSSSALLPTVWGSTCGGRGLDACTGAARAAAALMVGHAARLARGMAAVAADTTPAADAEAAAALGVTEFSNDAGGAGGSSPPVHGEHRLCHAYETFVTQLMQV
jgi:hypothetical protein